MRQASRTRAGLPLFLLCLIFLLCLFADWIAPYGPDDEERMQPFHPPVPVHLTWKEGELLPRPFIYATTMKFNEHYRRIYRKDRTEKYFLEFGGRKLVRVPEPAKLYLLGTDSRGRDLFSRILYGGRISLSIGVFGASLAALAGLLVGGVAGYRGGRTDEILMRFSEFFIMIPAFYFLLALRSALPPETGSTTVYFLTIGVLSLIGWGGMARVIRGLVFSIRQNDFILAAKALGRSDWDILKRHVFPHTFAYLFVVISISIPSYILMESALSILGLGIQEPQVSWGSLLQEAMSVGHLQLHPWVLYPGMFLFLTAWCFNVLGDALKPEQEGG